MGLQNAYGMDINMKKEYENLSAFAYKAKESAKTERTTAMGK